MRAAGPRVVLVTGASSGIGAAVARRLAGPEYQLALVARRADRLNALVRQVESERGEALAIAADLADPGAPAGILDATLGRFGRLDVLINNAGMGLPQPFALADAPAVDRQIRINLIAPMVLTRLALPHLAARRGAIINVGSSITCAAVPIFGAYGATKAGLAYWNDALRRELRPLGVSVSLVEPGPVATEFFQAVAALKGTRPGPSWCAEAVGREGREAIQDDRVRELAGQFQAHAPEHGPPALITASVGRVARQIVRLIDRPRRRVSVLRRAVWPCRVFGALIQAVPALGDALLTPWIARLESRLSEAMTEKGAAHARPDR
jgi:short-subunit dehydrogenase